MFNINAQQLLLAKLVLHFQNALQKRIKCTFFFKSPSLFSSDLSLGKKYLSCSVMYTRNNIESCITDYIFLFFLCLSADRAASIMLSETLGELHQHLVKSAGDFWVHVSLLQQVLTREHMTKWATDLWPSKKYLEWTVFLNYLES